MNYWPALANFEQRHCQCRILALVHGMVSANKGTRQENMTSQTLLHWWHHMEISNSLLNCWGCCEVGAEPGRAVEALLFSRNGLVAVWLLRRAHAVSKGFGAVLVVTLPFIFMPPLADTKAPPPLFWVVIMAGAGRGLQTKQKVLLCIMLRFEQAISLRKFLAIKRMPDIRRIRLIILSMTEAVVGCTFCTLA